MSWSKSRMTWTPDLPPTKIIVCPNRNWTLLMYEIEEENPFEIIKVISPSSEPYKVRGYEISSWETRHMAPSDYSIFYKRGLPDILDSRIR